MKRTLTLFFCAIVLLSCPFSIKKTKTARAEETFNYAYIPDTSVAFYSDAEETSRLLLFYLPETYFVRILGETDGYYRVSYLDETDGAKPVTGYVSAASVIKADFTPSTPYLRKKIEVTYYAPGYYGESGDILSRYTVSCAYYGNFSENGKEYCYVLRGDSFGYVDRPMGFTYPRNTEFEDHAAPTEAPSEENSAEGLSPAQIVFLVLLCLLIPTLAALILRSPKKRSYPDDDFIP